jgi:aminoglycoside phosphotransferase family enzyme/predicted kinase
LRAEGLDLIETHISMVFLGERDVWKVKKPVSLGFLDFSTLEQRREACEAEVSLNRRLAPQVYYGVQPITRDRSGRHRICGDGDPVDWAVHMQRLPDDQRADVLLGADRLGREDLNRVAERIAGFHDDARTDDAIAQFGTVEAISVNVRENFAQTRESIHAHLSAAEAAEIEAWQTAFLDRNRERFADRIRTGRVRDGHGDLRLEHVYFRNGSIDILDCIEFNERFRYGDVGADVAFLTMDLAYRGRVDLAERFLAAYARSANDFDLYPLMDFYESYRAYVRGKVASMLAADMDADARTRERAARSARRYYLLALASERRSVLDPMAVAVGGIIASGKSTVADSTASAMGAPVIDADRTRKHLLGVTMTQSAASAPWSGAYAPEITERTYAELMRRARAVLESGRPVILDASFRSRAHRAQVRALAAEFNVPFRFIECRAPADVNRRRLRDREGKIHSTDARADLYDEFVAHWEPVTEFPPADHIQLDTSVPLLATMEMLRQRLNVWPEGMTD